MALLYGQPEAAPSSMYHHGQRVSAEERENRESKRKRSRRPNVDWRT